MMSLSFLGLRFTSVKWVRRPLGSTNSMYSGPLEKQFTADAFAWLPKNKDASDRSLGELYVPSFTGAALKGQLVCLSAQLPFPMALVEIFFSLSL